MKVESGQTVREAMAALEKRADVRFAEPNWIYHASSTSPDDPRLGGLWGLNNTGPGGQRPRPGTADADIDAPEAWDVNRGNASTVVGVVDSGVAWEHPDLAPNIWSNPGEIGANGIDDDGNGRVDDVRGWDFAGGDNNPWDYSDHGTHVAGTIAARGNNGVGVTGVAWQASIMPIRSLNASGSGSQRQHRGRVHLRGRQRREGGQRVAGRPGRLAGDGGRDHQPAEHAVRRRRRQRPRRTTTRHPSYPCNYTAANLICVAATDNTDALASFSNYGATSVDLAAPGRRHRLDATALHLPRPLRRRLRGRPWQVDRAERAVGHGHGGRQQRGWSTLRPATTPTTPTGRSGPARRSTSESARTAC